VPNTSPAEVDPRHLHRLALEEAARWRAQADEAKHAATEELKRRMRAAIAAGVGVNETARRSGVSRWTLYAWLQEPGDSGVDRIRSS
jgi:DNA invertase Pin-like site-specific DNA recombinase